MINLIKKIEKKVNGLNWSLVINGVILMLLAILIVKTDFVLRLVVGLFVLVIAYTFIYGGYKLWSLKKEIKKHFNL
jgi:hypothetical protein